MSNINRPTRLGLRARIANRFFGAELDKLRETMDIMMEAYRVGPAVLSPATLEHNLKETDSQLLDLLIRQRGFEPLLGAGFVGDFLQFTEADRLRAVGESRHMAHFDVQTRSAVNKWTDFGFGQHVTVVPEDEAAKEVWDEFWGAKRNAPLLKQRNLHKLSDDELIDGEQFLVVWISTMGGECTLRRFRTEDVKRIEYAADDPDIPLFYVTEEDSGGVYYPSWMATEAQLDAFPIPHGSRRADVPEDPKEMLEFDLFDDKGDKLGTEMRPPTVVVIIPAMINEMNGRGWPQFLQTFPWTRAYKGFLQDRATIAKTVAMFVDKLTHKGGSRAQERIIDQLASTLGSTNQGVDRNPPPAAGSIWVQNEGMELDRRPLTTGAGDARMDGLTLLGQVTAGDGVPQHWRGRPDAMQNRATAREVKLPWNEQIARYQTFWSDVFSDLVEVVLTAKEKYGSETFTTLESEVSIETARDIDQADLAAVIDSVTGSMEAGVMDQFIAVEVVKQLVFLSLNSFGIRNPKAVVDAAEERREEAQAGEEPVEPQNGTEPGTEPEPGSAEEFERQVDEIVEGVMRIAVENASNGSADPNAVAEFVMGEYFDRFGQSENGG